MTDKKLPEMGCHIFESGTAYRNYKKEHPEYIHKFWESHCKQHWWEFWRD